MVAADWTWKASGELPMAFAWVRMALQHALILTWFALMPGPVHFFGALASASAPPVVGEGRELGHLAAGRRRRRRLGHGRRRRFLLGAARQRGEGDGNESDHGHEREHPAVDHGRRDYTRPAIARFDGGYEQPIELPQLRHL